MSLVSGIKKKLTGSEGQAQMLKGATQSAVMRVAGLIVAYIFAFVVARSLGPSAWGEFSLAFSVLAFGAVLGIIGLDNTLLKLISGSKSISNTSYLYSKGLILVIGVSILSTLLIYYFSDWIAATMFDKPSLANIFRISSSAILPFALVKLNASVLQGLKKVVKYVFLKFMAQYLFGIIILVFFLQLNKISHVVITSYIIGVYLIAVLSFYWVFKEKIYVTFTTIKSNAATFTAILSISIPLLFAGLMLFINSWIDTIMVGIFLEKADVGIYNIALKISGLLTIVIMSVNVVVAPVFAESYADGNFKKLQNAVLYSTKVIFVLTIPIFLLIILFPELILGIFGKEFIAGRNTLIILCIGYLFSAFSGSVAYILQMTGSQVAFLNITVASAVLGIVLNFLLIPKFGITGAAIATSTSMILWNSACVIFINFKYNIKTYFRLVSNP